MKVEIGQPAEKWTPYELAILKDNYFYLGSKIMHLLSGRSANGIGKKARKLGIVCEVPLILKHRLPIPMRTEWTPYEDAILIDNYFYLGSYVFHLLRKRTAKAAQHRARKLGLRCDTTMMFNIRRKRLPWHHRLRSQVLTAFGNCCVVPGCDWVDPRVLQLDHINGGGHWERKRVGSAGIYKKALEHPEEFQLLCANHHAIKTQEELYGKGKFGKGHLRRRACGLIDYAD